MPAVSVSRVGKLSSAHSTRDTAKIIVPALRKNIFAALHTATSTALTGGNRYGGSSIVNGSTSLRRIVDLNSHAAISAEVPPPRYSKNIVMPCALNPHQRVW